MAKDDATQLIMYGGLGYVAYRLALEGKLGVNAQQKAVQWFGGGTTGTLPGGPNSGTQQPAPSTSHYHPPAGPYGSYAAMAAANPNFGAQMLEWQRLRDQRGEDPWDWNNFRGYEMAIGAPDPGPLPCAEFANYGGGPY